MLEESGSLRTENSSSFVYADVPAKATPVIGYDACRSIECHKAEILEAMKRVLDSGTLILGPEVLAFENEFARFVNTQHAVGMSSGTDALIVAMKVLGIGPGHEVITVANGPVPTASAIRSVGATPFFVDVDASFQMDPLKLKNAIRPSTRCVIPIHLYGMPANIGEIVGICKRNSVFLIEDCAQAHGTHFFDTHVGGFGDIGCFSFYPTKNLGALGDAGMCITNNADFADRLREVGQYGFRNGQRKSYAEGINSRLDEIQAACLRIKLRSLQAKLNRRRELAAYYLEQLSDLPFALPISAPGSLPSWHQFVIRCHQRRRLMEYLNSVSIQAGIHYEWPVHHMPAFSSHSLIDSPLSVTDLLCQQVVSLPIFPELHSCELERVVRALHQAARMGIY